MWKLAHWPKECASGRARNDDARYQSQATELAMGEPATWPVMPQIVAGEFLVFASSAKRREVRCAF